MDTYLFEHRENKKNIFEIFWQLPPFEFLNDDLSITPKPVKLRPLNWLI